MEGRRILNALRPTMGVRNEARGAVTAPPPDAFAPYRLLGTALALAVIFVAMVEIAANAASPTGRDFISFWGAARLALAGEPAAAYHLDRLHALQSSVATFSSGKMPFPYPPVFLLLVLPFGILSFPVGLALWSATTFAIYMLVMRRALPGAGWLPAAFAPVLATAAIGQNGFVTAAIFIGGLLLLGSRPFLAGLLLGCLAFKPQLGLLLPVAMIAGRHWRAIGGAALSSIGVFVVGIAAFGLAATQAWVGQMPLYADIASEGLVGWAKFASVYASMRQLGVPQGPALAIHGVIAAAAAATVWKLWRTDADPLAKASILAAATMLISPYLFIYDGVILGIAFLWLARSGARRAILAPLWLVPFISVAEIAAAPTMPNLLPIAPLGLMIFLWLHHARPMPIGADPAGPAQTGELQRANATA
jgi:hypothetical protein